MRCLIAVPALLLCAGCATIPRVDDMVVAEPVNCETARRDLVALEQMRPTAGSSLLVAVNTVTPGGLITGIVSNDMESRGRIFDGSFAREVADKKTAIRETCAVAGSTDPVDPTRPISRDMQEAPPIGEAPEPIVILSDG